MKYYIYNRLNTNGKKPRVKGDAKIVDAIGLDYKKLFSSLASTDEVVIVGGDPSINHFIRRINGYKVRNNVYVKALGYGSDFVEDIGESIKDEVLLNPYIEKLPTVKIKNNERPFINGIGFGLDGYCCEEADKKKDKSPSAVINYTNIAIEGMLLKYKPCHVDVEVDGKAYSYDDVWFAATMYGRYFGGGMKIAPSQKRNTDTLTLVIFSCRSRMLAFSQITKVTKGTHVENKELVKIFTGKNIHVKCAEKCAAEIDGVTILNESEYWATI